MKLNIMLMSWKEEVKRKWALWNKNLMIRLKLQMDSLKSSKILNLPCKDK